MTASPKPPVGGRVHLGSPIVPMNPSGRYLRHRVAAERAHAADRRRMWRLRGAAVVLFCLLYLVIGRDLIAVARAKTGSAEMEVRSGVHELTADIKGVAGGSGLATASDQSVPALTSAAALSETEALSD